MLLIQKIARKLGGYRPRKQGEEFIFSCPKCQREKLEINPKRKLFHCFRCGYKGNLEKLLSELHISNDGGSGVKAAQQKEAEPLECKIPGTFHRFITGEDIPYPILELLMQRKVYRRALELKWGVSTDASLRGRLIIPILEGGNIVSYIARAANGVNPKELSGPQRSLYLYNIDEVQAGVPVVLTEGVFDAEAVRRTGFISCAIMGSHLSDIQVGKLLAKHPSKIILLLDGDKAGIEGGLEAYQKLIRRTETPILRVVLFDEKDPDDFTTEKLQQMLSNF